MNRSLIFGFLILIFCFGIGLSFSSYQSQISCNAMGDRFEENSAELASLSEIKCQALLSEAKLKKKIFSRRGLQKFSGNGDRKLIYDYKAGPESSQTLVLIHGLGDDMFSLQKIAELAEKDGFGILRIDLHGHGETLKEYLSSHGDELPAEIDYMHNVDDIISLIEHLHIRKLSIVGHSYGGAIALRISEIIPRDRIYSTHVLAPYVQRIDKYLSESVQSPEFLLNSVGKAMAQTGFPENTVNHILDPLFRFSWDLTKTFRFWRDLSNAILGLDKLKDRLLDPVIEKYMADNYRKYFLFHMKEKESDLSENEKKLLDLKVEAAIKVTKGIRGLDYINTTQEIRPMPPILQIIGGSKDKLVIPQQLKEFTFRLNQYGIKHEYIEVEGENSHHLFPQTMPEEVYKLILEALTRPAEPHSENK